jgi:parallel beta-helix repeat protein
VVYWREIGGKIMRLLLAIFSLLYLSQSLTAREIQWDGQLVLDQPVILEKSDQLSIKPGTVITFKDLGRIEAKFIKIDWQNVTFQASDPLNGMQRILLRYCDVKISNCHFRQMQTTNKKWHNAFLLIERSECEFSNNTLKECSAVEWTLCQNAMIKQNHFAHCTRALVLHSARNAVVHGNTFRDCLEESILINSSQGSLIENNRLFDNHGVGICLYGKADENQIIGNSIFAGKRGIQVGGSRNKLISNLIKQNTEMGIRIDKPGVDNMLTNNVIWGAAAGIYLTRSGQGNVVVQNSVIANCQTAVSLLGNGLTLDHCAFWQNENSIITRGKWKVEEASTIQVDPQFKNPAEDDFRLNDQSTLIKAGIPQGTSIGLYP